MYFETKLSEIIFDIGELLMAIQDVVSSQSNPNMRGEPTKKCLLQPEEIGSLEPQFHKLSLTLI